MMLLAAILSEATRTKSDPCIPIKYSILQNSYEMWLFKNDLRGNTSPFASSEQITQQKFARGVAA